MTLPDGKVIEGQSWRTTPYDIASQISKGLADNTVVSKVGIDILFCLCYILLTGQW